MNKATLSRPTKTAESILSEQHDQNALKITPKLMSYWFGDRNMLITPVTLQPSGRKSEC